MAFDPHHFGVYFTQFYLRLSSSSHSPFMLSRFPHTLFFGRYGSSPFGYDISHTHFSCFLFEWPHGPSTVGQLYTRPAWTARSDIVSFRSSLIQLTISRISQLRRVSFIPPASTFPLARHSPEGQGSRTQCSIRLHSLGPVESRTRSRRFRFFSRSSTPFRCSPHSRNMGNSPSWSVYKRGNNCGWHSALGNQPD